MDDRVDSQLDYEALCLSFYAYQFGRISFLELLERLETALHIRVIDKAELADEDISVIERESA
jgi:hypothetical protein